VCADLYQQVELHAAVGDCVRGRKREKRRLYTCAGESEREHERERERERANVCVCV